MGLDNTRQLAALAGDPQLKLRFIHVAGTNGKGSTCAMLESIYRANGLRVGLFTSPHLIRFGERIQIDRRPISDRKVIQQVVDLQPLLQHFPPNEHPTFFEVVTVMALRHFAAHHCDLVIWETGLGGRLDATNIVTPLASVITNISYDHQQWLGETLASIAAEKAGIIKPGIPVVTGVEQLEALQVIRETARRQNAPLTEVPADSIHQPPLDRIRLALPGSHQKHNAAVALATVRVLDSQIKLREEAVDQGLAQVAWPGRLQSITLPAGQTVLLDGAHNLAGVQALAAALRQLFPAQRFALILGILSDKDWKGMGRVLAPLADRIFLVPVASERSAVPAELEAACREANPSAQTAVCSTVAAALQRAATDPVTVVTGSLYLVGEALELIEKKTSSGERPLNEWTSKV
jgi:dihydrofolate synthase/folylpolyglutamate synthase